MIRVGVHELARVEVVAEGPVEGVVTKVVVTWVLEGDGRGFSFKALMERVYTGEGTTSCA